MTHIHPHTLQSLSRLSKSTSHLVRSLSTDFGFASMNLRTCFPDASDFPQISWERLGSVYVAAFIGVRGRLDEEVVTGFWPWFGSLGEPDRSTSIPCLEQPSCGIATPLSTPEYDCEVLSRDRIGGAPMPTPTILDGLVLAFKRNLLHPSHHSHFAQRLLAALNSPLHLSEILKLGSVTVDAWKEMVILSAAWGANGSLAVLMDGSISDVFSSPETGSGLLLAATLAVLPAAAYNRESVLWIVLKHLGVSAPTGDGGRREGGVGALVEQAVRTTLDAGHREAFEVLMDPLAYQ
ncbi:hypothetical protein HDU67_005551 [Dinochytrium kinnereticum]|nr:hypothetical protein HDU67_005551 [Dinochytrium kinnereticum]